MHDDPAESLVEFDAQVSEPPISEVGLAAAQADQSAIEVAQFGVGRVVSLGPVQFGAQEGTGILGIGNSAGIPAVIGELRAAALDGISRDFRVGV